MANRVSRELRQWRRLVAGSTAERLVSDSRWLCAMLQVSGKFEGNGPCQVGNDLAMLLRKVLKGSIRATERPQ